MGLTVDLYCNDGSPIGVNPPDIYDWGVGGAELAMMTWAETMAKRGHDIRIYNDGGGAWDGVEYLPRQSFKPNAVRDVFILYRSPAPHTRIVKAGVRLFWSCDQYTVGNYQRDVFPFVDKVICISPYHVNYHRQHYGVEDGKIGHIDLGVRLQDYDTKVERIPGRCIFCSIPDRGLATLRRLWPKIRERVPDASLVITSDYRLWGKQHPPNNHQHRMEWLHEKDVVFLGKIPRGQLVQEQLRASCQPYPMTPNPNAVEELFCISAAECQVSGAVPVTTAFGALETTNEWGVIIDGMPVGKIFDEAFVGAVIDALTLDEATRARNAAAARARFDWDRICGQWERLIETGEFDAT